MSGHNKDLVEVGTADKLGTEEEIFPASECKVGGDHVDRVLEVALVRVEDARLVVVVLAHHLHAQSIDGSLEVALLGVYHHSNVSFFSVLPQHDSLLENCRPSADILCGHPSDL